MRPFYNLSKIFCVIASATNFFFRPLGDRLQTQVSSIETKFAPVSIGFLIGSRVF